MNRVVIEVPVPDGVAIDRVLGWSAATGSAVDRVLGWSAATPATVDRVLGWSAATGSSVGRVLGWSASTVTAVSCEILRRAPNTEAPLEDHPWYIPVMRYLRGNTHDAGAKEVLSRMLAGGLIREAPAYELTGKGMAAAKTVGLG